VLHVLVFCYVTSAFCDMILCCIEVLYIWWSVSLFWFADLTPCFVRRWHLPCYDVLLCAGTCWPTCWTCASLGQAVVAVRTRVCDCTHSTVTACLADQRAQEFCVTMDRGSQPTTSSANSQRIYNLMSEQCAQVLTLPDLSQFCFVFSGHYELAVFILDRQAH